MHFFSFLPIFQMLHSINSSIHPTPYTIHYTLYTLHHTLYTTPSFHQSIIPSLHPAIFFTQISLKLCPECLISLSRLLGRRRIILYKPGAFSRYREKRPPPKRAWFLFKSLPKVFISIFNLFHSSRISFYEINKKCRHIYLFG